ncbi:MAG: glycosyltransferase, partial [Methylococcaceae bacterium]|nr:glycosyltransferase [Methylococcaceae bacterium]
LLQGLADHELSVDLLAVVGKHGWLPDISGPNIRVIQFKTGHTQLALPELARYLRRERPDVLMPAKDRAVRTAVLARRLARVDTRLVGQLHNNISALMETKTALQRWLRCAPMRWLFPDVDLIIAVSEGVVQDTLKITGLPTEKVIALPNPVVGREIYAKSLEVVEHPWFADTSIPIIIGAGRLTREKDFATLIRAFGLVRRQKDCRLLILGEGPLRWELETQIAELGLAHSISLPGYVENPFAYMAKSSLFVLSSVWEGSGNVLIEALALGIPVVSTDCPHGPGETLAGGKFGTLVAVGDHQGLAEAMLNTLSQPLPATELQRAVTDFSVERSTRRYLQTLGFTD